MRTVVLEVLAALLASFAAGCDCDCGRDRASASRRLPARSADTEPAEPAEEPPPPAVARDTHEPTPTDPRFGTASLTFTLVEGRPQVKVRLAIPAGASVTAGDVQPAAIYFDNGPPVGASLTAGEGAWQSGDIRLPQVVTTAERATLRIPTRPQTTFVWEMAGAWASAASGPVKLESGH